VDKKDIGVRPTLLTKNSITEGYAGCRFVPKFAMNVELCEMCRSDTYAVFKLTHYQVIMILDLIIKLL
jgi:hypothetical protein